MKILEINKFYFVKRGAERHFFDVVDLLQSSENEVAVFSMNHPKNLHSEWSEYFLSTVGFTNEYTFWQKMKGSLRDLYSFEAKRKINKLLDEFQPEVVHIHNIYHQLSPMILFEIKKRNIPIVMTVHDYKLVSPNYNLFHNGKIYDRCKNGKFYQCFIDKCFKNSYAQSFLAMLEMYWHELFGTYKKNVDVYIVPSEFVKNILTDRGIESEKIKVMPHFISDEEKASIEERSGDFALCPGGISKAKGADKIVNVFKNIRELDLFFAGENDSSLGILSDPRIKELGYLNKKMLREYVKRAKFVISGSELPETFGLIALESITEGKPFIGFKSGAYPEIIENGKNGFLVENEEEMRKVIQKIIKNEIVFDSRKIRENALEKYSAKRYEEELMNVFSGLTRSQK